MIIFDGLFPITFSFLSSVIWEWVMNDSCYLRALVVVILWPACFISALLRVARSAMGRRGPLVRTVWFVFEERRSSQ